ncbi:2-hydroxychromene-2-carboxylate isomerase [Stenotrophomonas rhizophila]|uniref:2-hydroxychromene-2-carboxylate isomerase n=1 Tax=Stenotrophomonas rhizophila TaxID=216778 RepID=UPI0033979742
MTVHALDYYVWMNSDWALLGADTLSRLVERLNVPLRLKPVDLPVVYARTGGVLLHQRSQERQSYRVEELARWSARRGVAINVAPRVMCPDASLASRLVIAVDAMGKEAFGLHRALLAAQWCYDQDISDEATLRQILAEQGLDPERAWEAASDAEIERTYLRYTEEAIECGVFGSPTYVWHGQRYWGQDRLEMLGQTIEQELSR